MAWLDALCASPKSPAKYPTTFSFYRVIYLRNIQCPLISSKRLASLERTADSMNNSFSIVGGFLTLVQQTISKAAVKTFLVPNICEKKKKKKGSCLLGVEVTSVKTKIPCFD